MESDVPARSLPLRCGPVSDDHDLVREFQRGQRSAFEKLYRRHKDRTYWLAFRLCGGDANIAADITQEIFLKVYRQLDTFELRADFGTWLYRVAANTATDCVRKLGRHRPVSLEALSEERHGPADGHAGPEEIARQAELRRRVQSLLDSLPLKLRTVIVLREMEGMSYAEIAEVTRRSKRTVEAQLRKAREKLKRVLGRYRESL